MYIQPTESSISEVDRRAEHLHFFFDRRHRLVTSGKLPETLEQRAVLIRDAHDHLHRVHTRCD
jgi:hypothetical protein